MSDGVSRRGLFQLGLRRAAPSVDVAAAKRRVRERWEPAAGPLLRAIEPLAGTVCDAAFVQPGRLVLDAGAGDGNVALEAARRGAKVCAVDLSPAQVQRGAARSAAAVAPVDWSSGDLEALPYDDDTFDAVVSVLAVALTPRPRRTCRELLRVLKVGGTLALAVPTRGSLAAVAMDLAGDTPRWGRAEDARAYLEPLWVDTRDHALRLGFESLSATWEAFARPFGIPPSQRGAFEDEVAERSPGAGAIGVRDHWLVATARRAA
jgi:SAM-dependent methyltransferase